MLQTSVITLILIAFCALSSVANANEFVKGDTVLVRCGFHFYKGEVSKTTGSGKLKINFENPTQNNFCGKYKDPARHTIIKYEQADSLGDFSVGAEVLASCGGIDMEAKISDLTSEYIKLDFDNEKAQSLCGQGYKSIQDELDGERLELLE